MKRLFNMNNHVKKNLVRTETKRKGKRDSLGERQCFRG